MLMTREDVAVLIDRELKKNISNGKLLKSWSVLLNQKYGIPKVKASDLICMRTNIRDESDFILFCIYETLESKPKPIEKIFTESEIKEYSVSKFKIKKIKFPLKLNMLEVDPGQQYIGTIDTKQLMALRDAQIIRYNEETQRTLTKRIAGDVEFYTITLDRAAVESIEDFMERGVYIPTTLTFNLPEDAIFSYDSNSKELIISDTEYLDITDGYHRYIAISNAYTKDPNFNQPMEFRITSFSSGKANQFIWQEDQKTRMKKVDSDSYNQTDSVNKLVQQLNNDSSFLLAGAISRNKGIIRFADLSLACNIFYYLGKQIAKKNEVEYMLETKKSVLSGLNTIIEQNPALTGTEWSMKYVISAIYLISNDPERLSAENVDKLYQELSKKDNDYIFTSKLSKNAVTRISKVWKECE